MAKIAVYSGNSYCMEVIRGYINNAETKFGMKNQTAYFESVDMLEWDMETTGTVAYTHLTRPTSDPV